MSQEISHTHNLTFKKNSMVLDEISMTSENCEAKGAKESEGKQPAEEGNPKKQTRQKNNFNKHRKDSDSKCPICIDFPTNICSINICNHIFCFKCIKEWATRENSCPLCRERFTEIEVFGETGSDTSKLVQVENRLQRALRIQSDQQRLEELQEEARHRLEELERHMERLRERRRAIEQMQSGQIDELIQSLLQNISPIDATSDFTYEIGEADTGSSRYYDKLRQFFGRVRSILQFTSRANINLNERHFESLSSSS